MHSVVDFQVDWPKLLFKSRPQLPCRDIIHVATSISRRDINLSLCSLQLMSSDVATSISCRDISSSLLQPSTGCSLCRDLNLLSRHQFMSVEAPVVVFGVVTSVLCRDNSLSYISFIFPKPVMASRRVSCHDLHPLSRHHSFSFCSSLSCLSCDPCRDLITGLCKPQNCNINQPVAFISIVPF